MSHKLLLADDSVTIQKVIELTFADEDIEVIAVSNGAQAISIAPIERPDIVLADVGMPERDGYEVAAFIKRTPGLSHVPVLLLTGAFEPIDEGRAKAAGCDGVLVKPFEPQMVISRVKDLIAGRRPLGTPATSGAMPGVRPAAPQTPPVPADEYFDRLGTTLGARSDTKAGSTGPTAADLGKELANWQPESSSPASAAKPAATTDRSAEPTQELPGSASPKPSAPAASPISHPAAAPAAEKPAPPPASAFAKAPADKLPASVRAPSAPSASLPAPSASSASPPASAFAKAPADKPPVSVPAPSASSASLPAPSAPSASPLPAPIPTLAQAFAALLAAEQGKVPPPPPVDEQALREDVIEQVTRNVIERMTDRAVRDVVLEVAERLVREEIDRIKTNAR